MTLRQSLIGLAALALTAVCLAQEQDRPAGAGPKLELSGADWDFGEVWQAEPLQTAFQVKNAGDAPLTIELKSSCGCTEAKKVKNPLPPGESDTLEIRYDSLKRTGPTNQTVTLTTNDPARPQVLITVRGNVKPMYELLAPGSEKKTNSISFGRLYQDSAEQRSIKFHNRYTEKMPLKLQPGPDNSPYEVELKELEPGQTYELIARTKPPLTIGDARGRVVLETGVARLPQIEVLIFGAVQPPVTVDPARVLLPRGNVAGLTQVVRVVSAPAHPVKVLEAQPTHASVKAEVRPLAPPAADKPGEQSVQEIVLSLPPGEQIPDDVELAVELLTDAKDPAFQKVRVPIKVIGAKPNYPPRP